MSPYLCVRVNEESISSWYNLTFELASWSAIHRRRLYRTTQPPGLNLLFCSVSSLLEKYYYCTDMSTLWRHACSDVYYSETLLIREIRCSFKVQSSKRFPHLQLPSRLLPLAQKPSFGPSLYHLSTLGLSMSISNLQSSNHHSPFEYRGSRLHMTHSHCRNKGRKGHHLPTLQGMYWMYIVGMRN